MKKILTILGVVLVIGLVAFFALKLVQKCDSCENWFVGTGYEANILSDVVTDDDQTICKPCAEKQHALETTFGKSLDDFKKSLFD